MFVSKEKYNMLKTQCEVLKDIIKEKEDRIARQTITINKYASFKDYLKSLTYDELKYMAIYEYGFADRLFGEEIRDKSDLIKEIVYVREEIRKI